MEIIIFKHLSLIQQITIAMKLKITIVFVCLSLLTISYSGIPTQATRFSNIAQVNNKTSVAKESAVANVPHAKSLKAQITRIKTNKTEEVDEGIDMLDIITAMNGSDMPKPPVNFRDGTVSSTNISNYLTKTENGFIIQLPNQTNIPTPTVYNETLYLSGGFGSRQYYAFQAKTGEKKWAVNLDDDGPTSCAATNNIIVFNTESCTLFACEGTTGKQLWSHWLGDPLMCMPAVANGKVFTSYPSPLNTAFSKKIVHTGHEKTIYATHVLACFDLKTGKVIWQKWIDGDVMSAPVAENNLLYITTFPGTVYKVDQLTGQVLSAKYMRATSAPVITEGEMVVSRKANANDDKQNDYEEISHMEVATSKVTKGYMKKKAEYLDKTVQQQSQLKTVSMHMDAGNGFASGAPANSGAFAAEENIGQSNVSSLQSFQGSRVVFHNGKNYNTMGDEIVCTEPDNGEVVWRSKIDGDLKKSGGFLGAPPVSVRGYIIVATYEGEIKLINAESGKTEHTYTINGNLRYQPIVYDGWIYVTTTNGKLVAINTWNPNLTGWATWGGNAARTNKVL